MTYLYHDWLSGIGPPKGWDCADAIADGWTRKEIDAFMRATLRAWTPPESMPPGSMPPGEGPGDGHASRMGGAPGSDERSLGSTSARAEHRPPGADGTLPGETRRAASFPSAAIESAPGRASPAGRPRQAAPEPSFPAGPKPSSRAVQKPSSPPAAAPIGADGISDMPEHYDWQEFNSEVFLAKSLARDLERVCESRIVKADGKVWAFGPTAWREIDGQKIRLAVHAFDACPAGKKNVPIKLGKRMIDGILNEVGTRISDIRFFDNPAIGVNVLNGVVMVDEAGKVDVRPHDPDHRFRFTVEAGFHLHTDMRPPEGSLLHRLLHGAFQGDADAAAKIDLIGEMLGAAAFGLATRVKQPKAFILLGETANNGKSTIASLFQALLPQGAVSSIAPAYFNDEKRIIDLSGKAANVADELSAAAVSGEEFKAAVTGNPIQGRSLYKDVVTFRPRALHCFTTNTLPRFTGGIDRGLRRRLVVIQFNRTIPDHEVIVDIVERIEKEELELLLGFAISGAQRMKRNGNYTIPASSTDALNSWLLFDPLNEWFDIRVAAAATEPYGGWLRTSRLFEDFRRWAIEAGYRESFLPPVNTFSQRLKTMPNVSLKRMSSGMIAQGVVLNGGAETVF